MAETGQVAFTRQSLTSLAVKTRVSVTWTFRRAPHRHPPHPPPPPPALPQVGHGQCPFFTEHRGKSRQGLCEPALLNCTFRRVGAFWAGSQVAHWVPIQPVWAGLSFLLGSTTGLDSDHTPQSDISEWQARPASLSAKAAREGSDSSVSTKDKGPGAAGQTQGHASRQTRRIRGCPGSGLRGARGGLCAGGRAVGGEEQPRG